MSDLSLYSSTNDGVWYEGNTNSAIIRWKASVNDMQNTSELNFAVELFKNGDIKYYYGLTNDYPSMEWISGVSAGDNIYYQFTEINNDASIPQNYVCDLKATHYPKGFEITRDGGFGGVPTEIYENFEIKFRARDENGISNSKILYFSTDGSNYLVIDDYSVLAGDDDVIEYGETVYLSIDIKNLGEESITEAEMEISIDDVFITLIDSTEILGDFEPNEKKSFETAFAFEVSNLVPDEHEIDFNTLIIDNSGNDWASHIYLTAFAPDVYVGGVAIDDGGNGGLDPGETADMIVNLFNGGGAAATNLEVTLSSSDPYVSINTNTANVNILNANNVEDVTFNITAANEIPLGYIIEFDLEIMADNEYFASDMAYVIVGLINEGFETGDYSAYPWYFGGDAEWIIDNNEFFEGTYSARSGDIEDDQTSSLFLEIFVLGSGEISFYKKVSTESNYDYLIFYIDGIEKASWDGDQDWSIATFPVGDGLHNFEWKYEKDYSVSNGSDCGWIDFITFPPFGDPNPQLSYDPESFVFTIGNEIYTDTITIVNEGEGPLIYSIEVVDTLGNSIDWLNLDSQFGGINSGNEKQIIAEFDATNLEEGNYVAYIIITDHLDNEYIIPVFMFVDVETGSEPIAITTFSKNIPNPFRNQTNIVFTLSEPENVSLEIFDHYGGKVKSIMAAKEFNQGSYSIKWDATNDQGKKVASGLYYYGLSIGNKIQSGKMILLD